MPENTLTVVDNRTGKSYTIPVNNETVRAMDFRQMRVNPDDFGLMTYDPAFTNTACCESRITLHRRRQRYPALSRIRHCRAGRELHISAGRLSADQRRAAHSGAGVSLAGRAPLPHVDLREHQEVHGRLPLRCASDGHAGEHGGRAFHVLSRFQERARCRDAESLHLSLDRQNADHRRLCLPPPQGPALSLSGARPQLHRELHEHAVEAQPSEVPDQSGAGARAGRAVHSARRSRAELLDQRHARGRQLGSRSVPGDRGGGFRPGRPVARRRQ